MKRILIVMLLGLAACSAKPPKADIPPTASPEVELGHFDEAIDDASLRNIDILASADFREAVKWRDEAREDLSHARPVAEVLEDIRVGRGYLMRANSVPPVTEARAAGIFEARRAAIKAGAANFDSTRARLGKLDEQVSYDARKLDRLSVERIKKIQRGYVMLERDAIISAQLNRPISIIRHAKKQGAVRKAPRSLKNAQLALSNAESVIASNVRTPANYNQAVENADREAYILNEVMQIVEINNTISEPAAIQLVMQTHQLNKMQSSLSNMQGTLSAKAASEAQLKQQQSQLQQKNSQISSDLEAKNRDLASAQAAINMQAALEKARAEFSSEEAETYQQGSNLVIRMKNINFPSGASDIPEDSIDSLEKVSEIAKTLNAAEVKVEGHTDSVGSENINKEISEKRAEAVAEYLKSNGLMNVEAEGYGFEKPLASNKSKEGRAQNRRVDIVITPSESSEAPDSEVR
ncbi:MAG: hypothetical protein K0R29_508 [Pseudobdellovibrio sp.]|jgi:outer membrane protein OmpA-like peptidoglycan-associated protein|nr:hypothetical protein [Pseudobdellovibrio sp.]